MKTFKDLFQDTIRDIYNSEKQLLKAMPKMAKAAQSQRLKEAIQQHIQQTEEHVKRIEAISTELKFRPTGKVCQGTVGLVNEANEEIEEFRGNAVGDAAIIASAQKAEHYEISNYGSVISWAQILGFENAVNVLKQTLAEEEEADRTLSEIASQEVNQEASQFEEPPAVKKTANGKSKAVPAKSSISRKVSVR